MRKTTVEIADALLAQAKSEAARDGMTLKDLVDAALREYLTRKQHRPEFRLRDASVDGTGVTPEFSGRPFSAIRDAVYEGRGT